MSLEQRADEFRKAFRQVQAEIGKVIVGHQNIVEGVLTCLFVGGHALLEGVPGLGKTLLVRTLAQVLDLHFSRIQFTPDLMPSDIIGTNVVLENESGKRNFQFQKGPIFAQIVLADEINRATPKTQSALLEAMQEHCVTVGGIQHRLQEPFFVMATQNPIEQEGTYPLPEAQVDRFIMKVIVDYPKMSEEQLILRNSVQGSFPSINQVVSVQEVTNARDLCREIYMDEKIEKYILDIVFATRKPEEYKLEKLKPLISYGASPRGSINLGLASKAQAFLNKRGFVIPEDIRSICKDVLRHRIGLTYEAEAENVKVEDVIEDVLRAINVP